MPAHSSTGAAETSYDTELRSHLLYVPREQWHTLIRDAHPGYITWDEFERNQDTLRSNSVSFGIAARGSQAREGVGLLQGRVLCGRCGARMRTRYQQAAERSGGQLPVHRGRRASRRQAMSELPRPWP